jgi:hypothetical protein
LKDSVASFKEMGRILNIILFGSYARNDWVDEPRDERLPLGLRSSDHRQQPKAHRLCDLLVQGPRPVAERQTPVSFIEHSRREVNTSLHVGQYFFSDVRRDGIVLYELDKEPLPESKVRSTDEKYRIAKEHFDERFSAALSFLATFRYLLAKQQTSRAAFELHQAIEHTYSAILLTLTNSVPLLTTSISFETCRKTAIAA